MAGNESFVEANRELWNRRTAIHVRSDFYDVPGFLAGATSLRGPEIATFVPLIRGKSVLHLQCHFGQDSLSLAREGAQVTGVDLSDTAIEEACRLRDQLGLEANFVRSSIFDLENVLSDSFDFVFASYGVFGWLPDLNRWAEVVHHFLKPGGAVHVFEFHPVFQQMDDRGERKYDYFEATQPDREVLTSTYTDGDSHEPLEEFWWNHPISSSIDGLLRAGMHLREFREYPYSPYKLSEQMIETAPGRWAYPHHGNQVPYLFSFVAEKPPNDT